MNNQINNFDNILIESIDYQILHEIDNIDNIIEKLQNGFKKINIQNISKKYSEKIKTIENKLSDYDFDIDEIKKDAIKTGVKIKKEIESGYKSNKPYKQVATKITQITRNKIQAKMESLIDSTSEKITFGVMLFFAIIYINTLILSILTLITMNPKLAFILTACIFGPIIEESAKAIAIKQGHDYGLKFTFGFAVAESIFYIVRLSLMGFPIAILLAARLLAIILHMTTVSVQIEFDKKNQTKLGYIIAILMHMTYNSILLSI